MPFFYLYFNDSLACWAKLCLFIDSCSTAGPLLRHLLECILTTNQKVTRILTGIGQQLQKKQQKKPPNSLSFSLRDELSYNAMSWLRRQGQHCCCQHQIPRDFSRSASANKKRILRRLAIISAGDFALIAQQERQSAGGNAKLQLIKSISRAGKYWSGMWRENPLMCTVTHFKGTEKWDSSYFHRATF